MQITDLIIVEKNILSTETCDELIQYFENSPDLWDDGKVEYFVNGQYQGKKVNKEHKNCTQFMFPIGHKYADIMTKAIHQIYDRGMQKFSCWPKENLAILDYTIRKYPKGEGVFQLHVDQADGGTMSRLFACIIYLNDVEEGGETFFPDWNLAVRPEKGKVLLFPCNWLFPHGSNLNVSHDKYICTAFINLNYDVPMVTPE